MHITQQVRDYAAQQSSIATGLADKAREFREQGSEIYVPALAPERPAPSVQPPATVV
jgi:hypothetical protein